MKSGLNKVVRPVFEEVYFPWARNPDTGALLPFDFYVPSLNLIVEAHGAEHYQFTPLFHRIKDDFIKRQVLDMLKEGLAEEEGFNFLAIDGREYVDRHRVVKQLHSYVKRVDLKPSIRLVEEPTRERKYKSKVLA